MPLTLRIPRRLIVDDRVVLPCHRTPDRYVMPIPVSLLSDEAAIYLIHQELDGGWERQERDQLDEILSAGSVFVDVGAHWGIHTLHAATAGATVFAIEPDPFNLSMLAGWLDVNGLRERATLVEAAVTDRTGGTYLQRNTTMGHVLVVDPPNPDAVFRHGPFSGQPRYTPTAAIRLDSISLPPGPQIVLKIDVEGGEPAVLRGATNLLSSGRVTHIIWEINAHYDEIVELLSPHGYSSLPLNSENALSTLR